MAGGSVDKAYFINDDTQGEPFYVQYNPKEFKFDKPVSWTEGAAQGQEGKLEFQKTSPATMSMELTFDSTNDGADVRLAWVNKLLELTNPTEFPIEGQAEELTKSRPPRVMFGWGSFEMTGVITSVNVSYLMFKSDGTPLRARVSLQMKEWTHATYAGEGAGSSYGSEAAKLVQLQAGETLSSVAAEHGTTAQEIADANNIADPLDVPPGTELIIL